MKTATIQELEADHPGAEGHLSRALELAQRVRTTSPNPRVGCVIVKQGEVLSEGWHMAPGLAHAEAMALANLDDSGEAKSATAYVTLEPCSFVGRTPACSQALIDVEVATVVIAALDPNPRVSGSGVAMMESAGIEVIYVPEFEQRAWQLNPGYRKRMTEGLPYVRCKMAMSLDGRTALADGSSKWITGPDARRDVQALRAASCAVVTGIGTILQDDPSMNFRADREAGGDTEEDKGRQPLRVILDSKLRTPASAKTLSLPGEIKIFAVDDEGRGNHRYPKAVEIVLQPAGAGTREDGGPQLDLHSVLESLAERFECNEVLIESGPTLAGAFVQQQLVDELVVYMAPKLLGNDARALFRLDSIDSLAQGLQFELNDVKRVGSDVRLTLKPQCEPAQV